ncbi:hypothetical protein BN1723_001617 [Verticillium longisporum]|uniref:Trafficking protein particle complex subunit n=1 Tax=Verticillium longisporum TaxID=100787 RepID=A0A0G4KKP9_VERLO|nr:hypothetical protein BN1723_001617 [Verticillium longisporum]
MLSSPDADADAAAAAGLAPMRNVLHQIYINLWVEYVVKNPLAPVEHKGGAGVRNELFELGLDQFVRGLS